MGDYTDALLRSQQIVESRKTIIPKVLNMEKERMDLEFKQVLACADQLSRSGTMKEEAANDELTLPIEITPWRSPLDVNHLCSEISLLKSISSEILGSLHIGSN